MPYQVYKDGDKFCVHKKVDGQKGPQVKGGCHASETDAQRHMRALYHATEGEKKELTESMEDLILKELEDKSSYYDTIVPWGVTTFSELDSWRETQEDLDQIRNTSNDFQQLVSNVLNNYEIKAKAQAIKDLADEFASRLDEDVTDLEDTEDLDNLDSDEDSKEKASASTNDLPDSAFLYIEPGGKKDSSGKTEPRKLRHLRYKKADGSIDLPHLRNALSRLGQPATGKVAGESWLTEATRKRLQARAKKILANANKSLGDKIKSFLSDLLGYEEKEEDDSNRMMFWKEVDGSWRWMAKYSNKFRDRDNPPEIIAAKSHLRFVDRVDKGVVPYPDLWLWHRKELKWGATTWVGYDDSGFAMAFGTVDPGCEPIAEALAKLDPQEIRVSHGMPVKSIARDPDDPTVIIEHDTAEISPLPAWAAANMLTSFYILEQEDKSMPIPAEKRKVLVEELGISGDLLDKLEKQNAAAAKEATDAGIQSKETDAASKPTEAPKTDTTPAPAVSDPAPVQKASTESQAVPTSTPSVQEIADAVSAVLNEKLTAIDSKFQTIDAAITTLQGEIKALKETDQSKIEKTVAKTPVASLSALISRSVIGSPETRVDGRGELAKSKPAETKEESTNAYPNLGVWMVDKIIKDSEQHPQQ